MKRLDQFNEYQFTKQQRKRFVDFINKRPDHECALLGAFGFSTSYIASRTGLSGGQIQYRLTKAEIKRTAFRNGETAFSRLVMSSLRPVAEDKLVAHLKSHRVQTFGLSNMEAARRNGSNGHNGHKGNGHRR